jgi:hypothetical protein
VRLLFLLSVLTAEDTGAPARFVDVTDQAGIRFTHVNGAFGKKYLPETMGSGCAFFDFDSDGDQDILLVNSTSWPGSPGGRAGTSALYRNRGNGTFEDVTKGTGFDRSSTAWESPSRTTTPTAIPTFTSPLSTERF